MDIILKIDGMHCGCVQAVGRVLSSIPSVSAVTVDLAAGRKSDDAREAERLTEERQTPGLLSPMLAGAALLARWKPRLLRAS